MMGRTPASATLLAGMLAVTSCGDRLVGSSGRGAVAPTVAEQQLLAEVAHGAPVANPLDSALIVGGPSDAAELGSAGRSLGAALDAIVQDLPRGASPPERGRQLLRALFAPRGGRPLLARYDADATTLYEIVATGRFNCVSSSMLYILAARRAGLDARPVLLPSHARVVIVAGGRRFVVETTTAEGFDPPAWVSRATLDRARPKTTGAHVDLYADERGTEVDWNALLGIAYGNLGIMAEAKGDTALAAALLAREAVLTPPAEAPLVKAQQASLLSELATRALRDARYGEALLLALRAASAAGDPETKRLTEQNITAIASQELTAEGARMPDDELLAFPERVRAYPGPYGDVRALMLTSLATRRLEHGDVEGSAAALREAAAVASNGELRGQAGHNARLGELNRIGKLSATDPEAAWAAWKALGPADPTLGSTETDLQALLTTNRAIHFANAGRCAELDAVLAAAEGHVEHADSLRGGCHERHAMTLMGSSLAAAAEELRVAVRVDPRDPHHRDNLVIMLEKQVDALVHGGRCAEVPSLVAEGRGLAPRETFWDEATAFCNATSTHR